MWPRPARGVSGDLLAHCIDTAIWMNGRIDSIMRMTETFVKERMHNLTGKVEKVGIDDACIFMGRFANGSLANFESTRYARGHKALYTFEINGENMSLFWDLHDLHRLQVFDYKDEGKIRGWKSVHVTDNSPDHPVHGELVGAGPGHRLRRELHAPGGRLHPGTGERQAARPDLQGRARNAVRARRDPGLGEEPEVGERGEGCSTIGCTDSFRIGPRGMKHGNNRDEAGHGRGVSADP